ncbi:MAG: hypothetical protein ACD_45C00417G0010 [uncultured bacterium]|nr:MAG: hypothetical protein ACD_45C00417G0010 [uncultured bacterium]
MNKFKKIIACFIILFSVITHAENTKLIAMQIAHKESATQVTFVRNQLDTQRIFSLSRPKRLVIDFPRTRFTTSIKTISLTNTLIKNIRYGYPKSGTLRVVLDINANSQFKILSPSYNTKLIIAIYSSATQTTLIKPSAPPLRPIVVVIDPGHGGKDPGALGFLGTKEKNVTLAIAKQLVDLLNQQPRVRALLTRRGDYFVPLRDRLKLARKANANLFIAVHADSYFNTEAGGASVYALSQHGATSEAARWLARRDNYSELGGVDLSELTDQSYLLRSVLIDLAQTATITDSLRLGTIMLSKLRTVTTLHYSRVEQAPFMVLKSPDIPSILVETGFLSNTKEERHLRDKNYQTKIAQAIYDGIRIYLQKNSLDHTGT